jgi:hypothetical protein
MKNKKEIIENLIRDGHIGLDEALVLLETEKETICIKNNRLYPMLPSLDDLIKSYYGDRFMGNCKIKHNS